MTGDKKARRYIIDASVALKWYLPERGSAKVLKWYQAIKKGAIFALSPDYLLYECANVLLKRHKVKLTDTIAIIDDLTSFGLELVPIATLRPDLVVRLADQYQLTVYDAIYLELARLTDTKLITADSSLLKIKPLTRSI